MWFGQTGLNINRFETSLSASVNGAILLHAGVTLAGRGHSVISVFLPQDAVSKGMELIVLASMYG